MSEVATVDKVDKALRVMHELQKMDKGMLQSKKFVGFMTIQICGTALMFYGIYSGQSDAVLMMIQGSLGAAQTAFLGAQAWHDKHTKTAKMAALNGGVAAAAAKAPGEEESPE